MHCSYGALEAKDCSATKQFDGCFRRLDTKALVALLSYGSGRGVPWTSVQSCLQLSASQQDDIYNHLQIILPHSSKALRKLSGSSPMGFNLSYALTLYLEVAESVPASAVILTPSRLGEARFSNCTLSLQPKRSIKP